MTHSEIRQIIRQLWKQYGEASTMKDQRGLLAEIAWLEHKLQLSA